MINRITAKINIPPFLIKRIDKLKPFNGSSWDRTDTEIKVFKRLLKKQLLTAQSNTCAYCGLPLDETSKTEIEHFAPKGGPVRPKHTEFVFEIENLYLSCNLCNSPIKKGTMDTVIQKFPNNYSKCIFSIVHPRYDDPNLHYSWTVHAEKVLIQGVSAKGSKSISTFKLDSSAHSEARARIELLKRYNNQTPAQKKAIEEVLGYR